jgi:hypothetical protein
VEYGEMLSFRLAVRAVTDVAKPFQSLDIESGSGVTTYSDARFDLVQPPLRAGERAVFEARLVARLPTGNYTAGGGLHDLVEVPRARLLAAPPRLSFYVSGRHTVHGAADLGAEFGVRDRVQ